MILPNAAAMVMVSTAQQSKLHSTRRRRALQARLKRWGREFRTLYERIQGPETRVLQKAVGTRST